MNERWAAALLLLVIGLAAANIEMPVVCFNAIDPTPIISATSENMLLPPGPGYTQQWFLSQATLFASQVLWSSRQVACQPYPIEFDVIPAFNVGVPVGNVEIPVFQPVPGIYIIPRETPTILQLWVWMQLGDYAWEMKAQTVISKSELEDWRGIVLNNEYGNMATRMYIYGTKGVVEVDIANRFAPKRVSYASYDEGFLNGTMNRITGAEIVNNVLYITRGTKDLNKPGEIVMFDVSKPITYLKTVYIPSAAVSLISWEHAAGNAIYWTANQQPQEVDIWSWDLTSHTGEPPAELVISQNASECLTATQRRGYYALLTFTPCDAVAKNLYYVSVEMKAEFGNYQVTGTYSTEGFSNQLFDPKAAIKISNAVPASAIVGTRVRRNGATTNAFVLTDYAVGSFKRSHPAYIKKGTRATAQTQQSTPPFCSRAACGPDRQAGPCPANTRCVYYMPVQDWICCSHSPFN